MRTAKKKGFIFLFLYRTCCPFPNFGTSIFCYQYYILVMYILLRCGCCCPLLLSSFVVVWQVWRRGRRHDQLWDLVKSFFSYITLDVAQCFVALEGKSTRFYFFLASTIDWNIQQALLYEKHTIRGGLYIRGEWVLAVFCSVQHEHQVYTNATGIICASDYRLPFFILKKKKKVSGQGGSGGGYIFPAQREYQYSCLRHY